MMELRERLPVLDTLLGESDLRGALRRGIINLSDRHPRTWMAFTVMVAGAGYALVLLFPYFLVSTGRLVYPVLMSGQVPQDWPLFVSQVCSLLISAAFTYTLLTMRFAPPGRVLTSAEAPLLFGLVERLRQAWGNPRIHQLILDDGDDVRIVKIPRTGLPFFSTTALVIGLPLLKTLSARHLRVLLARRIGELPLRHNLVGTRLCLLNGIWLQYGEHRGKGPLPARMIGHFFALYAPLYSILTLGIRRRKEMNADRHVLDIINDQDIVEAISLHAVSQDFLASTYWPTIGRMANNEGGPAVLPYEQMTTVMRKSMSTEPPDAVIHRLFLFSEDDPYSDIPVLRDRLDNLGYSAPIPVGSLHETAEKLVRSESLAGIVEAFHEKWINRSVAAGLGETSNGRRT